MTTILQDRHALNPHDPTLLHKRFEQIDLYPVTCRQLSRGRSTVQVVQELLQGGARIVQYREKDLSAQQRFSEALQLRQLTKKHQALLVINDDVALALASGADGVHLGQDDFPVREARLLLGPHKLIGLSTHSLQEMQLSQQLPVSYINLGPIFATQTKSHTAPAVGLEVLRRVREHCTVPFTVMGGINSSNVQAVVQAGALRIAMVSALVDQPDIAQATQTMIEDIRRSQFSKTP